MPALVVLGVLIGLLIGLTLNNKQQQSETIDIFGRLPQQNSKIDELLYYMYAYYVDTLNMDSINEEAVKQLITTLDPHSDYIPAKDLDDFNSDFEGSFSGIGVQFNIQNDTVCFVGVVSGGPSEAVGILNGDKLIKVNDSVFVGKNINNEKVMHTLRGDKGTEVKLTLKRNGTDEPLEFTVVRGDIPVHSVVAKFMIDNRIGFIKVDKFSQTTYSEFIEALAELKNSGAEKYIIDLRGNPGGLMDQAVSMCNEFLERGNMIVYAKGKQYHYSASKANGMGRFKNEPIAVLIDEYSASAAEIFSGAMQDNDRGTIIGRRSFGKGLVQQVFPLSDQSAVKLTVARYYMPSGRCIQKPYKMGDQLDYMTEVYERYETGEIYTQDSVKEDTTIYRTSSGRIVHGGGGVMPDIFVGSDTTYFSKYYKRVINKNYVYQFAYRYTDNHREELNRFSTWQSLEQHLNQQPLLNEFVAYAKDKGEQPQGNDLMVSGKQIGYLIRLYIVRNILNDNGFYPLYMRDDDIAQRAVQELQK